MIADNPLASILKVPSKPSTLRPAEREAQLTHQALEQCVAALQALLSTPPSRGGKAIEYHEDEIIGSKGQSIRHGLGRPPRGYLITSCNSNQVPFSDKQRWTEDLFYLVTAAGQATVSFFLFVGLLALVALAPSARAAECAAYGYAQSQPVRFWLCNLAADTTTDAVEGDYRYNKDANTLQTFDGATWNTVGGSGGSTPTGTGYVHVTGGVQDGAADLVTLTSATEVAPNQGTTTTVLHGNAAGQASWGSVSLTADVSGILEPARGGTGLDTSATPDDRVLVSDGLGAWAAKRVFDCLDTAGNHLNYDAATNAFSCGTSSSTVPGGSDTHIQFNDGGAFGGDADFLWDKTNNGIGIGTAPLSTAALVASKNINAAYTVTITDTSTGTAAHSAFQAITDVGNVAMRSHASARVATQCGNTLGGTNDLISVSGNSMTVCSLGSQPIYIAAGNARRAEYLTDGTYRLVDSGAKPTCDAAHAGGQWFDAAVPDTYEVCTKDGSSVYAWRSIIAVAGGGGLSYAEVAAASLAGF